MFKRFFAALNGLISEMENLSVTFAQINDKLSGNNPNAIEDEAGGSIPALPLRDEESGNSKTRKRASVK